MNTKAAFADTDLCVKCGLCLPHCPTYTLSKNESESPRGRLALIQGWSEGALSLSDTLTAHIDSCLTCRACESMCPAQVPYARLVNDFRAQAPASSDNKLSTMERIGINTLTGQYRQVLNKLLRVYKKLRLDKCTLFAGINHKLTDTIEKNNFQDSYPALTPTERGHVALFSGCASEVLDSKTLHDAIYVLQHCGFQVSVPKAQVCCGAIDLHAGQAKKAQQFAEQNQAAFAGQQFDAVITVASGCGSTLAEYPNDLANIIVDINEFIAPFIPTLTLQPLAASSWLHTPCTLKNSLSKKPKVAATLAAIDGLEINTFDDKQHCCGAAGSYMLQYKETADALREKILQPLKQTPTDYLLTSNIGCALHLRAGIKQSGLNTEVLHPVSLLAQQLKA